MGFAIKASKPKLVSVSYMHVQAIVKDSEHCVQLAATINGFGKDCQQFNKKLKNQKID